LPYYQKWIDSGGTLPFLNGESQEGFEKRCVDCFIRVMQKEKKRGRKRIILVVHGGTIMALMDRFAVPKKKYFEWLPENGSGYFCEWSERDFYKEELQVCQII